MIALLLEGVGLMAHTQLAVGTHNDNLVTKKSDKLCFGAK
jgi:hypothetical protein